MVNSHLKLSEPGNPWNSLGRITLAFSRPCGKSFRLRVITKSALPNSAQKQNASSLGSGEIPGNERTSCYLGSLSN